MGLPIATITNPTADKTCNVSYIVEGSPDTIIQGLAAARVGDKALPHKRHKAKKPHGTAVGTGSSTVFINNKPAGYQTGSMTCGDKIGTSPAQNVIIGI